MKLYRQREWAAYRREQIKLHGGVCAHCLRSGDEVVLQVHHESYVKGRLPWEYPYDECTVLCRGCHAKEHGEIMPSKDWEFVGEDDLGGLDGECEYCGKELRYTHMVTHPNWGTMIVGEKCCDNLTESTASTGKASKSIADPCGLHSVPQRRYRVVQPHDRAQQQLVARRIPTPRQFKLRVLKPEHQMVQPEERPLLRRRRSRQVGDFGQRYARRLVERHEQGQSMFVEIVGWRERHLWSLTIYFCSINMGASKRR
ncbi:hypothetical protein [Sphingomonas sp.]|uniref:HNH endonuclease n=1 Tax=Sphingomonas sp. TaxID=28214 RepID=UPI001ECEEC29|nr:hypothetical protein [Sphingomonas sp.]MBX3593392.1 hypothetical protein [Sphingomonas sp.]